MAAKKYDVLKTFSPANLARLRGDRAYHTLAVEITQKTGVAMHPDTLRKWEDGTNLPTGEKLAALGAFFGIPIDDLFE